MNVFFLLPYKISSDWSLNYLGAIKFIEMSGQFRKFSAYNPIRKLASEGNQVEMLISPQIRNIIRKKVNSYIKCEINLPTHRSKQLNSSKKTNPLPKQYPEYKTLIELLAQQRNFLRLYKQKIEKNLDEFEYIFLKILTLAIDFECRVSEKELDKDSSITIQAFLFISWSLLQTGADKAAFYFASMATLFCQFYKTLNPIGQFLLIMAKISRKHFRYRESILMLKKALEYNWWKDTSTSSQMNKKFTDWLAINYPDELETYLQKYQVVRIFTLDVHLQSSLKSYQSGSVNKDLQREVFRDLFRQFIDQQKIRHQVLRFKVISKRTNQNQNIRGKDIQADIYNQLSFNFLQLNHKEESKIFAEKYQSGYTEPLDSKIVTLSGQLIHSIQKRTAGWHKLDRKSFELLFFVDVFEIVQKNRHKMRTLNQENILGYFKADYEAYFQNLLKKQMFSYEIPLPLEIKKHVPQLKKKSESKKFIIKQRSTSHMNKPPVQIIKKYSSNKVQQNLLFNLRGIGFSRLKLIDIYTRFIQAVRQKQKQGSFKLVNWTTPIS